MNMNNRLKNLTSGLVKFRSYQVLFSFNCSVFLGSSGAKKLLDNAPIMTVKDLFTVQVNTHLSNSGVKKLASTIN